MTDTLQGDPSPNRPLLVAAFLSFVWPGLGQLYQGRPRRAAVLAVPVLVAALALLPLLAGGLTALAVRLLDPSIALVLLVGVILVGLWRIGAVLDTVSTPLRGRLLAAVAALILVIVASHAVVGAYLWSFYQAGSAIFVADTPTPTLTPTPTPVPTDPGVAATSQAPTPPPRPASQRITVLIVGSDAGTGYTHSLTDTMIVATFDPVTSKAAMLSLPRDTSYFPMYDGGTYTGKLNSLMTFATNNPGRFPAGGLATLTREVGFLMGVNIPYYAYIDMGGFQQMVQAVGGVDLVVQRAISDPGYEWSNHTYGFFLSAGQHHLDSTVALAYVRSRMGIGDSDFTRAARQQNLLDALKTKLTNPAVLPQLPAFLAAFSRSVRTDLPPSRLNALIGLSEQVKTSTIAHYVLGPPYTYHPPDQQTGGTYTVQIVWPKWRSLCVSVFGPDTSYAQAGGATGTPNPTP